MSLVTQSIIAAGVDNFPSRVMVYGLLPIAAITSFTPPAVNALSPTTVRDVLGSVNILIIATALAELAVAQSIEIDLSLPANKAATCGSVEIGRLLMELMSALVAGLQPQHLAMRLAEPCSRLDQKFEGKAFWNRLTSTSSGAQAEGAPGA